MATNEENAISLGLDASDFNASIDAVLARLNLLNRGFGDFVISSKKLNQGTNDIDASLKSTIKGVGELTVVLHTSGGQVHEYSGKFLSEIEKMARAMEKARRDEAAAEAAANGRSLQEAMASLRAKAAARSKQAAEDAKEAAAENGRALQAWMERQRAEQKQVQETDLLKRAALAKEIQEKNKAIDARVAEYNRLTAAEHKQTGEKIQAEYDAAAKIAAFHRKLTDQKIEDDRRELRAFLEDKKEAVYLNSLPGASGRKARGQSATTMDTIGDALSSRFFGANVASTLITRGIGFATREIREAITETVEYEVQMAKIQAVTSSTKGQTDALGESLLRLSTKFGLRIADVQAAALDIYRNKAVDAKDAAEFMDVAFKLAKATGSSADDAAKALNMQLQQFSLDATHAGEVANLLFQSFRDGGPTLQEFNVAAARMESVLTPMGIGMKEQAALLTVFTKGGLSASGAADRITQAVIRLNLELETNKTLQVQLGATSIPELEARYGSLTKVIDKFVEANQRGVFGAGTSALGAGGIVELADSIHKAQEQLDKFQAGMGDVDAASKTVLDNAGERWNRLTTRIEASKIAAADFFKFLLTQGPENPETEASGKANPQHNMDLGPIGVLASDKMGMLGVENTKNTEDLISQIQKSRLDYQHSLKLAHLEAERSAQIKHNQQMDQFDKERASDIKIGLDVQLHRFEDTMRHEVEAASRAQENIKRAQDNLANFKDAFETGRFGRQMSLVKDQRTKDVLTNQRGGKLTTEAFGLVSHFAGLTGEEMTSSKDLENARGKLGEVQSNAEAHAQRINALFMEGKATKGQVLGAEMQVVAAAEKRKELEEKILGISKKQKEASEERADVHKRNFGIAQAGIAEALSIKAEDKNGLRDKKQVMDEFDAATRGVLGPLASSGVSADAQLGIQFQLQQQRNLLIDKFGRRDAEKGLLAKTALANIEGAIPGWTGITAAFKTQIALMTDAVIEQRGKLEGVSGKTTSIQGDLINKDGIHRASKDQRAFLGGVYNMEVGGSAPDWYRATDTSPVPRGGGGTPSSSQALNVSININASSPASPGEIGDAAVAAVRKAFRQGRLQIDQGD